MAKEETGGAGWELGGWIVGWMRHRRPTADRLRPAILLAQFDPASRQHLNRRSAASR